MACIVEPRGLKNTGNDKSSVPSPRTGDDVRKVKDTPMDTITIEKRVANKTGMASIGWRLGLGYLREKLTIKYECWCVVKNGKVIAECRGKKAAEEIADCLRDSYVKNDDLERKVDGLREHLEWAMRFVDQVRAESPTMKGSGEDISYRNARAALEEIDNG